MEQKLLVDYQKILTDIRYYELMANVFKNPQCEPAFIDYLHKLETKFRKEQPHLVDRKLIPYTIAKQIENNGHRTRHDYPMQTYQTQADLGGLVRWVDRCSTKGGILMTPAIKGVNVELIYQGGMLHKVVNMGDGLEGKDITINMYSVSGVPQQISELERVNIHGVVTMATVDVMEFNKMVTATVEMTTVQTLMSALPPISNATAIEALQFIPYMVNIPGTVFNLMDLRAILLSWDFMVPDAWVIKGTTREFGEFDEVITEFTNKRLKSLIYPTEGITFQVNDTHDRLTLGHTSRWPEWALKYIIGKPNVEADC